MAKTAKTAKSTVTAEQVAAAFAEAIRLSNLYNGAAPAPEVEDATEADEVEDDEDAEEVELTQEMIDTAAGEGIKSLRTLAQEVLGEDAPTKKADILEALAELVEDEDDEEEDEDDEVEADEDEDEVEEDEEDEEDEDEEDEGYDREDLEDLDLKALRKIAKEEGHSAADYKGMDQDALIDLIVGEADEDEDDEEEDEDDEEEVEELDEDALNEMSQKELLGLAKELGVKVPKTVQKQSKANHKKIVALILDSGEEE